MKVKIRKGDTIEIISGRLDDKGKRGEVIKVFPAENKAVVQGINIHKKHKRQQQTQGRTLHPGVIEFEAPVDISNIMLVCPKCDEPTRVSIQRDEEGVHRICKNCGAIVE